MKKSFKLAALFLLLSAGAFAKVPAKYKSHKMDAHDQVSFIPLKYETGFAVMVDKLDPGKSMVLIYDADHNVSFKNVLTKRGRAEKKYILSQLDNGNYTVEVYSKNHDVKTQFSVYTKGGQKIARLI